jgi:NAD(P)-dependent dehydrogenase (short-subunit alcohol dehydrogenase family)
MTDLSDAHTEQPSLKGRKAIVTGGTTGIGRAIAVLLASEGAKVFICGRDPDHLRDALARIGEVGEGSGVSADVTKPADLRRVFEEGEKYLGGLDIAVINAAVPLEGAAETPEDELRYGLEDDFVAYVVSAHQAAERMKAGSDIVLIGSMSAVSRHSASAYTACKGGVQAFAPALRKELAEKDIKVGLIEPGFTGADFQYPEFPPEKQAELINAAKMLRAEDIAVATHFMLRQPRRTAVSLMRVETRLEHP